MSWTRQHCGVVWRVCHLVVEDSHGVQSVEVLLQQRSSSGVKVDLVQLKNGDRHPEQSFVHGGLLQDTQQSCDRSTFSQIYVIATTVLFFSRFKRSPRYCCSLVKWLNGTTLCTYWLITVLKIHTRPIELSQFLYSVCLSTCQWRQFHSLYSSPKANK